MKISHSPPINAPPKISSAPKAIIPHAIVPPQSAARAVARWKSPERFHNSARSSRPPSSGKPGSRLNSASARLMKAR